jgi:ACS family hexuronate transporter-like MFS transporter
MFNLSTAPLAHHLGYGFVLTVAGLLAPIGLILLLLLMGNIQRLDEASDRPAITEALG